MGHGEMNLLTKSIPVKFYKLRGESLGIIIKIFLLSFKCFYWAMRSMLKMFLKDFLKHFLGQIIQLLSEKTFNRYRYKRLFKKN